MSAHVDKLAWAVSLLEGARRLDDGNRIPLFLLLGFAVENALKAYLEKKGEPPGKWQRSHDLADLYDEASATGLAPIDGVEEFVRALSPYHKDFVFRYPEKAGVADCLSRHRRSTPQMSYARRSSRISMRARYRR